MVAALDSSMDRRIVQLTYYSTRRPVSGGQKRIAALRGGLVGLGYDVRLIEVFSWMEALDRDDLKFAPYDDQWARRFPGEYETRLAEVLLANRDFGDTVMARIAEHAPAALWIEQPFMWPFLRRRLGTGSRPLIVYSAHNIEWQVRGELTRRTGLSPFAALRIQELECDLVRAADLVVNVSEPDQRWCEDAGARRTVLVRNASRAPAVKDAGAARRAFRQAHQLSEDCMVLLYVSAYWEPNWLGLADWCLPVLADLAGEYDLKLLLVGGVGIRAAEADLTPLEAGLIVSTGEVGEEEKDSAYAACDAVLLPVVTGGGTNLKSAEALLSDLPIAASRYALRGLETLGDMEGVWVGQDRSGFAGALQALVRDHFSRRKAGDPPLRRTPNPAVRAACSWDDALTPLGPAVACLLQS